MFYTCFYAEEWLEMIGSRFRRVLSFQTNTSKKIYHQASKSPADLLKVFADFHLTYEEDSEGNCVPIITLEVMSDSSNAESCAPATDNSNESPVNNEEVPQGTGVHFLTEKTNEEPKTNFVNNRDKDQDNTKDTPRVKVVDSAEYMTRGDGSVVCKLCGEILQSRTHWYRHKYKLHAPQSLNPAPLFQCEQCLVFFKSRKGYIGHIASRHSDVLSDTSPVLTNAQAEAMAKEQQQIQQHHDDDPEMLIPKSNVLTHHMSPAKQMPGRFPEQRKLQRSTRGSADTSLSGQEYDEKRIREEKMVNDIIDRVRRECEAQASGAPSRKNYNRRTTVMHT